MCQVDTVLRFEGLTSRLSATGGSIREDPVISVVEVRVVDHILSCPHLCTYCRYLVELFFDPARCSHKVTNGKTFVTAVDSNLHVRALSCYLGFSELFPPCVLS